MVASGASFLTGGMSECDLAHRRSVTVFCMLYRIRCNPLHPLYSAVPVPYVPVLVTRGAIAHRYTYAPPRCRTSQYRRTFILLSVSLWTDLGDPVFDGVGLAGFKSWANAFYWPTARSIFISCCFLFLFFHSICWKCGAWYLD